MFLVFHFRYTFLMSMFFLVFLYQLFTLIRKQLVLSKKSSQTCEDFFILLHRNPHQILAAILERAYSISFSTAFLVSAVKVPVGRLAIMALRETA